jgi:hypothetical protein
MVSEEPAAPLCRVIVDLEDGGSSYETLASKCWITQCCNPEYHNPKYFVTAFFLLQGSVYRTECNCAFSETGSRDFLYYILYSTSPNNTVRVKGTGKVL